MAKATPITDDEFDTLFAGIAGARLVVLAVSGGSDSVALMHLTARWRTRLAQPPTVHVATADHGLRDGSRADAAWVVDEARKLGFDSHLLTWRHTGITTGVQEAARTARYALMAGLMRELGDDNAVLVTAHTADDQAETLLMRLARGSGLHGLSAMAARRRLSPDASFELVRPLLGVTKARLVATLQAAGASWREDPSNARTEFERVRLRAEWETLDRLGLTATSLSRSAERLQRARSAVDAAVADLEARALALNGGAFAAIDRAALIAAPEEVRLRLVQKVLHGYGGTSPAAQLAKIEILCARLATDGQFATTLGGCGILAKPNGVHVFREVGRIAAPNLPLDDSVAITWDNRFNLSARGLGRTGLKVTVAPLGSEAYARFRREEKTSLPSRIAAGLPAFWSGQQLLSVPALSLAAKGSELPAELSFRCEFLGLPEDIRISD